MRFVRSCCFLLTAVILGGLLTLAPANAAPVDSYARYEPQGKCVKVAKPGTAFLMQWILKRNPGTGSSGLIRPCNSGGTSEHKDGRALDWTLDATKKRDRAAAQKFLAQIFRTNQNGVWHAKARRMGIMYIIWNDKQWSSYGEFRAREYRSSSCKKLARCSPTLRHRDHMHISLSKAGAAGNTSFYLGKKLPGARTRR